MKDKNGLWMDTVHWESVGDNRKAAQAVLVDPAATPLMELVDFTSMAWFHAFRARHWAKGRVPEGTADQSQPFIEGHEGFVDREIFKTRDDWWLDLSH